VVEAAGRQSVRRPFSSLSIHSWIPYLTAQTISGLNTKQTPQTAWIHFLEEFVMSQKSSVFASAILILASLSGGAQTIPKQGGDPPSTSAFDVISIHESNPTPPFSVGSVNPAHSGRFSATNYTAMILIQVAYGFTYTQISDVPEWVHSTRFEIRAAADPSMDDRLAKLDDEDARLEKQYMLQNLLSQRFGLKVHTSTRELPAYALVVANSGPKFLNKTPGSSSPSPPNVPKGHPIEERSTSQGSEFVAHGASMELLAAHLTGQVGTTVLDRTGLSGPYDFKLQCSGGDKQSESDWPSIFTALPEQLGLKLERIKGPVPYLVIDHIEKPTEN
jgi:uncharacterized protein (TIGR03435 family)